MFGLPDNIERSLQRSTSAIVIRQLRALSLIDAHAVKYDREKWRLQLGPVLDLWQQLTSSTAGLLTPSGPGKAAATSAGNSIDDFVWLENDLSCSLCLAVDHSISSLKKVVRIASRRPLFILLELGIPCYAGTVWLRASHSHYSDCGRITYVRKCSNRMEQEVGGT